MRLYSRDRTHVGVLWAIGLALAIHTGAGAQVGQNINVITGSDNQFTGDMFRQRQNESVGGISSVNTSHMMVAYVDYRTVDFVEDAGAVVPPSLINATFQKLLRFLTWPVRMARGRPMEIEKKGRRRRIAAAQAYIGLSFSDNAGKDWYTGLHPGHRSLPAAAGAETWDQSEVLRGLPGRKRSGDGDDASPVLRRRHRVHPGRRQRRLRVEVHRSQRHRDRPRTSISTAPESC